MLNRKNYLRTAFNPILSGFLFSLFDIAKKTFMFFVLTLVAVNSYAETEEIDPLEDLNRVVYGFNKIADTIVVKPLATGYQTITPDFFEYRVHDFFSNLNDVTNFTNSVFQLKLEDSANVLSRFICNTVFGLGGFFDVASHLGIKKKEEDFGQTLAYWGMPSGAYIVLPLFGPSTVRDTLGMIPDHYTQPISYIDDDRRTRNTALGLKLLDTRVGLFTSEQLITGDEYSFVRDAYLQRRAFLIQDGAINTEYKDSDF